MPPASNSISTRQHTEVLWRVTSPIAAGKILEGSVRDIKGYSLINFLVLANDAVVLDIEEANTPDGPFAMTASYTAVLDPNGRYIIRQQYQPSGSFARALLHNSNPGPVTELDLSGLGLPYGGGGAGSGAQGPQGTNPGVQGPQGVLGPQGVIGTGFQGSSGPVGAQGNQGVLGSQGLTGSGSQGNQGDTGPQGNQGTIGPQGSTGPQGNQGTSGAQGIVGSQGSTGPQGNQGVSAQGVQGPQGTNPGVQGPQGTNPGIQGPQGPTDGSLPANATVHSLYTEATVPDTTPITPTMTYDGSAVSVVAVPAGQSLVITDLYIGIGFLYWTLEVDRGLGGGFVPLTIFGFTLLEIAVTEKKEFKSPIVIPGGTGVQVRFTVTAAATPVAPIDACMTVRCYTLAGSPGPTLPANKASAIFTITDLTTTGSTEEVLNISEDAGTPSLTIPVPAATVLQITDYEIAAGGQMGTFRLQQTNDGVNWFTIGTLQAAGVATAVSVMVSPQTSWRIDGGANVAVRIAITTPDGATPVTGNLSGYRYS